MARQVCTRRKRKAEMDHTGATDGALKKEKKLDVFVAQCPDSEEEEKPSESQVDEFVILEA